MQGDIDHVPPKRTARTSAARCSIV